MRIIPALPIVLVSTVQRDVKNLTPFGMDMSISSDPPLYAIGVKAIRDTYKNIVENGEFVVAVSSPELVKEIEITAQPFPKDVSKFDKAGLTPVKSKMVKPSRVKECQANFECKLEWMKQTGDHYIVVGRVVAANIDDVIYQKDLSRGLIDPVYYIGAKDV